MADRLDAVLPLLARDNERFAILRRSLERNLPCLGTCWVVVPDAEYASQRALAGGRFRVIEESGLLGTTWPYSTALTRFGRGNTGWFVQQMVKMAIAQRVDSAFYLALDADVIVTRRAGFEDLVRDGRALTRVRDQPLHQEWYGWAERLLGLPRPQRTHGVTPALLHTGTMRALLGELAGRAALPLRALPHPAGGWRAYLMRNAPWTEYTLYFTFAEASGRFEAHHLDGGEHALFDNSVWERDRWERWEPAASFEGGGDAYFAVVQSTTGVAPADVWSRVSPWLGGGALPEASGGGSASG